MRKGYTLLLAFLLVTFAVSNAYPLNESRYFGSNGNPTVFPGARGGVASSRAVSGYAVPEGIELRDDVTYEYYPVFGKSYSAVVKSITENGPLVKGRNVRSASKTDWGIGISYEYDYTYDIDDELRTVHSIVDVSDVSVRYHITITLPALLDDSSLTVIEKRLWKNYFRRILEHEHGKADIIRAEDTRKKIEEAVEDIKGLSFDYTDDIDIEHSVEVFMGEETDKIGREWVKKIRENIDAYDRMPAKTKSTEQEESPMKSTSDE